MYVRDNGFMFGGLNILMGINLLFFIGMIAMVICVFILLVKFLRAGTKAFNIYIEKNRYYQNVPQNSTVNGHRENTKTGYQTIPNAGFQFNAQPNAQPNPQPNPQPNIQANDQPNPQLNIQANDQSYPQPDAQTDTQNNSGDQL